MTCAAAPKPARTNTTVIGDAATSLSATAAQIYNMFDKQHISYTSNQTGALTVSRGEQRVVCVIDTQADREDGEDVEEDDAEERRLDRTRDSLVRLRGLAGRYRDQLDPAEGEKRVNESLRKRREPSDECLAILEVRQALLVEGRKVNQYYFFRRYNLPVQGAP